MSTFLQNFWPAVAPQGVALSQSVTTAPYTFNLNGTYSEPITTSVNFNNAGFASTVSINSSNSYPNLEITVNGIQNGAVISETVTGIVPLTPTYTTQVFDIVSSVTCNGAFTAVSIGTGLDGFFPIYPIANNFSFTPYALSFVPTPNDGTITYTVYETLGSYLNNGQTYASLIQTSAFFPRISSASTNQILQFNEACSYLLVKIHSTSPNATLVTNFLQM